MARDIVINIGAKDNASKVFGTVTDNLIRFEVAVQSLSRVFRAIAGPLQEITLEFAAFGDQLDKLSARTDLSVEFLARMQVAANLAGTTIDQVGQAFFRAYRRIGNAETLTGPAARAIEELKINAKELAQLEPEQIFFELVDALNGVGDAARRSQLGFEIFGDNWRQIVPLIEQGSDAIKETMADMEDWQVLTTDQATAAAELTDELTKLEAAYKGIRTQIGARTAPGTTRFLEEFRKFVTLAGNQWADWLLTPLTDAPVSEQIQVGAAGRALMEGIGEGMAEQATDVFTRLFGGIGEDTQVKQEARSLGETIGGTIGEAVRRTVHHRLMGGGGMVFTIPVEELARQFQIQDMGQRPFIPGITPQLQATQGRLLTGGPGIDQAAQQGRIIMRTMEEMERIMNDGVPVRVIEGVELGKDIFEMEQVE